MVTSQVGSTKMAETCLSLPVCLLAHNTRVAPGRYFHQWDVSYYPTAQVREENQVCLQYGLVRNNTTLFKFKLLTRVKIDLLPYYPS